MKNFILLFFILHSGPSYPVEVQSQNKLSEYQLKNQYAKNEKISASKSEKKLIIIKVKKGMSFHQVAELLKTAGLIDNIFYFKFLAWFRGEMTKIKSGEYAFEPGISNQSILNILVSGKIQLHKITFPEGYNIYEIARDLEKQNFLKAKDFLSVCHDSHFIEKLLGEKRNSLEGYLFPDTYYLPQPIDAKHLIKQMVKSFFTVYEQVKIKNSKRKIQLNRHETVILASIVEKETGLAKERALIASVFYNRLKKRMRLESDPTILYGMMKKAGGLVPLNIRKKDILQKTPYNTYRISALPKGPISNPGEKALKAVFEPELSDFLYFVSRNDGSHVFSKTYKEHKKNVEIYQKSLIRKRKRR